ncbi:MAG: trypsin-like peptidase domain-containing protein [Chloroflexota bacterium]|nr:trypsin-like peptidase domain-containing protein [Chloroflexota bacterium]
MGKLKFALVIVLLIGIVGLMSSLGILSLDKDSLPFVDDDNITDGGTSDNGDNGDTDDTDEDYVSEPKPNSNNNESPSAIQPASADEFPIHVDVAIGNRLDNDELIETVAPAVVSVVTEKVTYGMFYRAIPQTGAGTGVIVSSDGYIVTNNHVIEGAETITVTLSDGRTFDGLEVASDPQTDLAVIQIEGNDFPYLHFLDDSLGQLDALDPVVAVGNALALYGGPTWTVGVVSNLGRSIEVREGQVLYDLIQTDAAINPGNSGGPLVNMSGQVVGINTAIATGAENIGFAISTNAVVPVISDLIEEKQIKRPWLGVKMLTVTESIKYLYTLSEDRGVLIVEVIADSPAIDAGLRAGDVVTAIDRQEVKTADEMRLVVQSHDIGDRLKIEYYRDGDKNTVDVVLGEAPPLF